MISELVSKLRTGELSPDEYVGRTFDKILKAEKNIRSFITLESQDEVLHQVKASLKRGGRLAGVLIAIKDNISTKGIRTTCASKMLENYIPPYDATVVSRLKEQGAVILGKTNMDEFAMGSTTETSYFGPTRNPWDLERTPGGSSGGSGSALAAGLVEIALGSDTGGSIRTPASFTSTFGLKPSYGTVSRYGLVAYANSLEQIGPMARNSKDLSILFSVIAGTDPRDSTTIDYSPPNIVDPIPVKGIKVGILKDLMDASETGVSSVIRGYLDKMSSEGAVIEETTLGIMDYVLPTYYIIAMSEASSNLARYDGIRYGYNSGTEGNWKEVYSKTRGEGFGKEVKRRILLGSFILSAGYYEQFYIRALKARRLIKDSLEKLFSKYDILISPTTPILPPKIGEVIDDPVKMYAMDVGTVTANLAAVPALSIPAGFYNNLPVGVQLMGRYLSDTFLMGISMFMEDVTGIKDMTAPL
ncbi:Asp-tRNA(Asn)/Glu-tRNA(Gln) amidotransferase subunit GatA [Metallosphaera tengchongensis]|uniref:Glutamyl-tRNA(Gln) amidotransferase subunit A n=1 Tax=Metallosphaera tengchongensis TaxID=1532350 RepID=A0A6N0NW50_9CREN|nr:Asp-tRNA(Asn)/Glu-tRNA(Gln) amidotransferase subunit GatA [Metallosphaera tengchongensis]QKQ99379.1 Asp-tRNA(Asn)/Glu-tRNA(Gln) amidotransferase subunit GatA [Metallosphaera tengchongensis]